MPAKRKRNEPIEDFFFSKKTRQSDQNYSTQEFNVKKCLLWFQEYAGTSDVIGPDGIEKFCEDISVEPENILMLAVAFTLNAERMCFFTKTEWQHGMKFLGVDCLEKFRQKLQYFRSLLDDSVQFKEIYLYAYKFMLQDGQKVVPIELAKQMLRLLLGKQWPLLSKFLQFLDVGKYKVMNKDQWNLIFEFSRVTNDEASLENYDPDGAWPVMVDEFVDWYREHNPQWM